MSVHNNILLSVVVPVYNGEQYIRTCIDSLLAQTLAQPFEIIIIDDGSTDRTASILREYAQKYKGAHDEHAYMSAFKVVRQENQGRMCARQEGIRISRGEYLGFVDSDDWVRYEMFENLLERALRESADIVSCGFINVDRDGKTLGHEVFQNTFEDNRDTTILSDGPPSFCNSIFRHTLFEKCEYAVVNVARGEDLAIIPCLFYYASHVVMVQECYYYYRNVVEQEGARRRTHTPINLLKDLRGLEDLFTVGQVLAEFFNDKNVLATDLICCTTKFPDLFNRYNYRHVKTYFDAHDMWHWYFSQLLSLLARYPKYYEVQRWYGKRENKVPLDCFRKVFGAVLEQGPEDYAQDMEKNLKEATFLSEYVLLFKKRVARRLFFEFFSRVAYKIVSILKGN